MSGPNFEKFSCPHCGGHVEYPSELAGTSTPCPHCQQLTQLPPLLSASLPPPPVTPTRPSPIVRKRSLSRAPEETQFRLNAVGIIGVVGYAAILGTLFLFAKNPQFLPRAVVVLALSFVGSLFLGWTAYRLGGRSVKAGNIVFTGCFVLVVMSLMSARKSAVQKQTAFRELRRELSDAGDIGEAIQALRRLEAKLSTQDARSIRAFQKAFASLGAVAAVRNNALQAFIGSGGASPGTFRARTQIRQRQELLDAFSAANAQVAQAVKEFTQRLRAEIDPLHTNKSAQEILTGLDKNEVLGLLSKVCEVDNRLCQFIRAQLGLLDSSWGKWTWNSRDNKVIFQDRAMLQAFNYNAGQIQTLSAEETSLLDQLRALLESSRTK